MNTTTRITKTTGLPDLRLVAERKVTFCIRFTPSFLKDVDAFAQRRGIKRTALIEEALRFYMAVKAADSHSHE